MTAAPIAVASRAASTIPTGFPMTSPSTIASAAFSDRTDYAAAKIAIFLASLTAAAIGVLILWRTGESVAGKET